MNSSSAKAQSSAWPAALTIAGSDSGGGAGIQADLKTFSALGVYGASAITALTAQNTRGVDGVLPIEAPFIIDQIHSVVRDIDIRAIKLGMLGPAETIAALAEELSSLSKEIPIILDPVMVAKGGASLLPDAAIATLKNQLLPLATLITPNLPEAEKLLDQPAGSVNSNAAMEQAAQALLAHGTDAVLIKGGHLSGPESPDLFVEKGQPQRWLPAKRIQTRHTHGTGCTLSAAITAGIARGLTLGESVGSAKMYLTSTLMGADRLNIGQGIGPVDHFHQFWPEKA